MARSFKISINLSIRSFNDLKYMIYLPIRATDACRRISGSALLQKIVMHSPDRLRNPRGNALARKGI